MDPKDIDFLKTGVGNGAYVEGVGDEDALRFASVVVTFMEDAIKVAGHMAMARGAADVSAQDTITALKLTAMPLERDGVVTTYWTRHPDWADRAAAHAEAMRMMSSSESDDELEEIFDRSLEESSGDTPIASESLRVSVDDVNAQWDVWHPVTDLDQIVKRAVDSTAMRFAMS